MGFLTGKKLLITGVLSNRSIAYGIAKACHREGAELAFSYVGERFKDRITEFAAEFGSKLVFDCDVGDDAQIAKLFTDLSVVWPKFDGFVHAIGFAPREAIAGDFLEGLSREGFKIAHDISAYSFPALAKAALPCLNDNSAVLTLTYLGAERVVPNYNTMGLAKASLEASVRYLAESLGSHSRGIRANGISAGPIKTLAASGIKDFSTILKYVETHAPLRRNVTIEDVGNAAAFFLSDLAAGITGEPGIECAAIVERAVGQIVPQRWVRPLQSGPQVIAVARGVECFQAYETARRRFPGNERAAVAAFALGRIAFDQRGNYSDAARWFRSYLTEQPSGRLARDALGRLMEAFHRAGDKASARGEAAHYLELYPTGPHAEFARRVTGE